MPANYIEWQILSLVVAASLLTVNLKGLTIPAFVHSHRIARWFVGDYPIYCIKPAILEAFDRTDALSKEGILADWLPSLPYFLLALPSENDIAVPGGGKLDYLVVFCSEEPQVKDVLYRGITIPGHKNNYGRYIQITATDTRETVWMTGTVVGDNGELIHDGKDCGGSQLNEEDRLFIDRIRNIIMNAVLAIEYSPELLSDISEKEITQTKGFGKPIDRNPSTVRYPRWLGENYQRKVCVESGVIYASPHAHWRRGHWRNLESGDGKRWRENRKIWIEPTFVNPL
ncbi:MAG: hypothetical protein MUE44_34685 [Oscillatoriaceae cyanobacterium Prado104]|jgi:hypothetical protein|nr:hypothetical protein [Oscillatoriaceae cyanobacterium Prado104]